MILLPFLINFRRIDLPRSSLNSWFSERRLEWIEDRLATVGHFNRPIMCDYFSCEKTIASLDTTEYKRRGGRMKKVVGIVHDDGTLERIGATKGGVPYIIPADDWSVVLGSTRERIAAWSAIGGDAPNHKYWMADRKTDWIDDEYASGRSVSVESIEQYFGPDENARGLLADYHAIPGEAGRKRRSTEARRLAWECWR